MLEQEYYEHYAATLPDEELRRRLGPESDEMRRFAPLLESLPDGAQTLLDVGCGPGLFLHMVRQRKPGLTATGVERSDGLAESGRRVFGENIVSGSAESLPFADATFDVVVACEVLEHLPHGVYERALGELERVARRTILVTVPFEERREPALCPYCGCRFDPNFHMREYHERDLRHLLQRFTLVRLVPVVVSASLWKGTTVGRWLRRVCVGGTGFPEHCICPQCGYRRSLRQGGDQPQPPPTWRSRAAKWRKSMTARIPKVRRIHWMLAEYELHLPAATSSKADFAERAQ